MASALYSSFKELLLGGDIDLATDTIAVVAVDAADYTFSAAHTSMTNVPAASRVGSPVTLTGKTITGGVFDAADITLAGVTGDQFEALVVYKVGGTDATSPLIAYLDTGTGLPATPNGNDINIVWSAGANKIFAL